MYRWIHFNACSSGKLYYIMLGVETIRFLREFAFEIWNMTHFQKTEHALFQKKNALETRDANMMRVDALKTRTCYPMELAPLGVMRHASKKMRDA
jgi:hypothetical protein